MEINIPSDAIAMAKNKDSNPYFRRQSIEQEHILKLQQGDESGLNYFYNRWYKALYWVSLRRTGCDLSAAAIAQEAFLRLWIIRQKIDSIEQAESFVRKQAKMGYDAWFSNNGQRFFRSLIRLDAIEDYQEFMCPYITDEDEEELDTLQQQEIDEEKKQQLQKVYSLLPHISENQQKFIKLCLQYSFSYDRIAWHLGGLSDYEVALQVEKTLKTLKDAITNTQKLDTCTKVKKLEFEGGLNAEQEEIMRLRYDMQYSFEDIARVMNMEQLHIQKLFAEAMKEMKNRKNSSKRQKSA